MEFRGARDVAPAMSGLAQDRPQALILFVEPTTFIHLTAVLEQAAQARIPVVSEAREVAEAGALLSYGPSTADLFRNAAEYVDRVLKGARPADLPIRSATRFELIVNRKTARTLGLNIPESFTFRADEILD
jgi:putative ABC transport system substrate-binding protein